MSVNKDPNGRRWVGAEVELKATPEQVWEAVATGHGVSSWFVPTEVRDDGTVVSYFGPGMEAVAKQTAYEKPHRFAAESPGPGPGAPPMATEWTVEARDGGVCVVRVVHSLFAEGDDWDDQLESFEAGWPWFFAVLRLYVERFSGRRCRPFRLIGVVEGEGESAWTAVLGDLGFGVPREGEAITSSSSAPSVAGVVEKTGEGGHPLALMAVLDQPAPGILSMFAHAMGGQTHVVMDFYFYGPEADAAVERDEPLWRDWAAKRLGPVGAPC